MEILRSQLNKTIIMVTHDPKAAARAQRTLHLEKGALVLEEVSGSKFHVSN
jgi:putative ABC transport system ATP-binding protein